MPIWSEHTYACDCLQGAHRNGCGAIDTIAGEPRLPLRWREWNGKVFCEECVLDCGVVEDAADGLLANTA